MDKTIRNTISELAVKALLYEVSASPKPGLVDRVNSGAHNDMNFYTFIDSSISLSHYFLEITDCIFAQYECSNNRDGFCDINSFFSDLQAIGIRAEKKMFQATGNVNTHKGAIYALGLIASAAAEVGCVYPKGKFCKEQYIEVITDRVSEYTKPIIVKQLEGIEHASTYGEVQFKKMGLTGARGEASTGYLSARLWGIPVIEKALDEGCSINDAMVQALLVLMSNLEDSNVIGRHDYETLVISRNKAKEVLALGGIYTKEGYKSIYAYDNWCIEKNISHGGSADLLAVAIFLKFLADEFCSSL